jgi:hypothetical protein
MPRETISAQDFRLVEPMVIIASIVILASMLLPARSPARTIIT